MNESLKSLGEVLERHFGFAEYPEKLSGGLSHKVYILNKENIIVKVFSNEISNERLAEEALALEILAKSKLVKTPKLIKNFAGEYRVPFGSASLSCYKKIEGSREYLLTEAPNGIDKINEIGSYLGKLHRELCLYLAPGMPKVSKILDLARGLQDVNATEIADLINTLSDSEAPFFITHGDFQQSNLLYANGKISGIIDFEYSTYDFRINDIAGCLSNLLSASENRNALNIIEAFVNGYQTSFGQELLETELKLMPPIIKLIWRVNLLWVEAKLKELQAYENRNLLETYRRQTKLCLNS